MAGFIKDQNFTYSNFVHEPSIDEGGRYYCRALNLCLDQSTRYCDVCPLSGGQGDEPPKCRYYDIRQEGDMPPKESFERTSGLIDSGLVKCFPHFVSADSGKKDELVEEAAIIYAAQAHRGTYRKGSGLPYIVHPMEVMMICRQMTDDREVTAAAALHDVVEDTPKSLDDVKEAFGERIATLVGLESENKREGTPKNETWLIRKQENLDREANAPIEAKMIMLADKISNMRATVKDHKKYGDDLWKRFNMTDPVQQQWYYRSVAEVLSELSDTPQYREYLSLLDQVF